MLEFEIWLADVFGDRTSPHERVNDSLVGDHRSSRQSPSHTKRHRNHGCGHAASVGILVTYLAKNLEAGILDFKVEPSANASANSSLSDGAENLICRNERVEEHAEKRIEEKYGHHGGLSELNRPSVVADSTHEIG